MELHGLLRPGHDVPREVARAGRLAVDLTAAQDPGPELEVRQLPREGLGHVEAPPHRVLREAQQVKADLVYHTEPPHLHPPPSSAL